MTQVVFLIVFVLTFGFLNGCEQKPKQDAMTDSSVQLVDMSNSTIEGTATTVSDPNAVPGAVPVDNVMTNDTTEQVVGESVPVQSGAFAKPSVTQIQTALKNAGFYHGEVDGSSGPKTKAAIKNFQTQNGLNADGKVGPKTWRKLEAFLNSSSTGITPTTGTISGSND